MFIKNRSIQMFYWKFLCDAKLITPLFFNISGKYLKWKQLLNTDTSWNYLLSDMAVCWGCISRRGSSRRGGRGTDEQPLSGSSNLNFKLLKRFVLKRWKENVLHFVLLNLMQRFLQIHREGWLFRKEVRPLLSKLIFTFFASCWNRIYAIVER